MLKWWMNPAKWEDDSRDDRPLESQVFARIRLQAMLAQQDALAREIDKREAERFSVGRSHRKSLREMYAERGLTVEMVNGVRQVVAKKAA